MRHPATSQSHPPAELVRVSGPRGLVSAIPFLLGFHPMESIVLLCLRGPRRRMGPVLRMDLPVGAAVGTATATFLAERAAEHATAVALLCYTAEANTRNPQRQIYPRNAFVQECLAQLRAAGVPVFDAMLIRSNQMWSYLHHDPAEPGHPLLAADDPAVGHLHSAHVGAGRAVLSDRTSLAATVTGPVGIAAGRAESDIQQAMSRFEAEIADADYRATVAAGCDIADSALTEYRAARLAGRTPRPTILADLIAVMADHNVRDSVISWAVQHLADDPLPLFIELARWTPDAWCGPICATLAIVAYRSGDGALAQVANDRARLAEPDLRLAVMLTEFFSSGAHPDELDSLVLAWAEHPSNPEAPMWQRHGATGAAADRDEAAADQQWSGR